MSEAPLRFELSIEEAPTHSSAGYFVSLPDGGIMPGPAPVTHVVCGDGHSLASYLLWHNPETYMGIVFADPGTEQGPVFVYVSGADDYRLWDSDSGLTPGFILIAEPGKSEMTDARALGGLGRVGRNARFWNTIGGSRSPLAIDGDLLDRPRPGVFYLLTHVVSRDPGRTWVAPFTVDGETKVLINGRKIVPRKRIDKWGGTGQWVEISEDPVRLEVFQTAPGEGRYSAPRARGLMYVTWRTPNATMRELGGVRPDDAPMPGTSRYETRVVREREIVRSGSAVLESASSQDGGPVAVVKADPTHVFWVGEETPLLLYEFSALHSGNPPDTSYTWLFDTDAKVNGKDVQWLLPALREHPVKLTAAADKRQSVTVLPLYAFGDISSSFDNPEHRRAYRSVIRQMLQAYSDTPERVAGWDASYWNNLLRSMEFAGGYEILLDLFTNYSDAMRVRLSGEHMVALQELFLDAASLEDPDAALEWAVRFHDEERDDEWRKHLLIRRAEIHAHYKNDFAAARRLLGPLARESGELAQIARVRLGDFALLEGDLNLATRYYANVQNIARRERRIMTGIYDALEKGVAEAPEKTRSGALGASEILRADRARFMEAAERQRRKFADRAGEPGTVPSLGRRLAALLDTSASENIRRLIEEGYLMEARQALSSWESELPLSKITGDYILLESRLYRKAGDLKRAYGMLRAYCDQVDASSYLPEAAKSLLECMIDLKMPPEEIREYGKDLRDRLEFHPVASELEFMIKYDR